MFGLLPSVVGPPTVFKLCVVWQKPLPLQVSYRSHTGLPKRAYREPIHTAASAGKWGSGSGGMMQSFAWDPSTTPLGSVVLSQEHAKRTDQFAFLSPPIPNTPRPASTLTLSQPMAVPHNFHQMHVYRDHVGYLQPTHPTAPDAV